MIKRRPSSFSDSEQVLFQTFADQAVIAMENARLFRELRESNLEVSSALAREEVTSEILRKIGTAPENLEETLGAIGGAIRDSLGARRLIWWLIEGEELTAVRGAYADAEGTATGAEPFSRVPLDSEEWLSEVAASRAPLFVDDNAATPVASKFTQELARREGLPLAEFHVVHGIRSALAVPIINQGRVTGVLVASRNEVRPFTEADLDILRPFADQAAIAIENARLLRELRESNAETAEALEREQATGEIMAIVGTSTTDAQPVFEAIVQRAAQLVGADQAIPDGRELDCWSRVPLLVRGFTVNRLRLGCAWRRLSDWPRPTRCSVGLAEYPVPGHF